MFKDNKYTTWYFNIIDNAKLQNRKKSSDFYYESHHIVPKSMGGTEQVLLTAKEHFICHLLLCKMVEGTSKYKMINALIKMSFSASNSQKRYSAKSYSIVRKLIAEKNTELLKGKPKSDSAKRNMKGRSGTWVRSEESKLNSSISQKKRFESKPGTFTGRQHKQETIEKYKNDIRRKHYGNKIAQGRKHYNNGVINKMCYPGTEPEGFVAGRLMNSKKVED